MKSEKKSAVNLDQAPSNGQQLVNSWQVVHAIPGRLRLRANSPEQVAKIDTFAQQLRYEDGVSEVRVNKQAGSLIVNFDAKALSLPQMLEILQERGFLKEAGVPPEEKQTQAWDVWQSPAFWQEQVVSLIPLIVGLLVTRGLGISGWRAILVYMLTATTTRQVMEQLESSTADYEKPPEEKTRE